MTWAPLLLAMLVAASAQGVQGPVPSAQASCSGPRDEPRVLPPAYVPAARLTLARCVQRDLDAGRWQDADARLAAARGAGPLLGDADRMAWQALVLRFEATRLVDTGAWSTLATVVMPQEDALPWVGPLVRGVAAARASWARQDAALQARARAELNRLDTLARLAGPLSEEERARLLVQGAIAGAQYERDEMQLLLGAAHDLEARLLAGDELRVPVRAGVGTRGRPAAHDGQVRRGQRALPRPARRVAATGAVAHRPGRRVPQTGSRARSGGDPRTGARSVGRGRR